MYIAIIVVSTILNGQVMLSHEQQAERVFETEEACMRATRSISGTFKPKTEFTIKTEGMCLTPEGLAFYQRMQMTAKLTAAKVVNLIDGKD